ncbi:MAG: thiamine pyrophosphate-binding protein, partial [Vicinamibacterales bacterium]
MADRITRCPVAKRTARAVEPGYTALADERSSEMGRMGQPMNPSQAVVASLKAHGVDLIFGLDGDHIVYLYNALADAPEIRVVNVKHENTAAIAAEVYARLTGRPGIVLTTAGPGATNALSGVAGAYAAATPIIHLCGGVQS